MQIHTDNILSIWSKRISHNAKKTTCVGQDNISLCKHCLRIALHMHVRHAVGLQLQRKQWWVTNSVWLSVSWEVEWDEVIWIVWLSNKKKERKRPSRKNMKGHEHMKVVSLRKIECTTCYFTMNHDTSISCIAVCDWSLPQDNYSLYS